MTKKNEQTLKQVLDLFLGSQKIKDKYLLVRIQEAWRQHLGPTINSYTSEVSFRKGILTVHISSAPLRQELLFGKDKLIALINEALQDEVIKVIRIY